MTGSVGAAARPVGLALVGGDLLGDRAVLVAQVVAAGGLPVDRDELVAGLQDRRGRRAGVHGGHARGRLLGAVGPVDAGQQRERDEDVDRRPGADHDDPLPDGLAVVGAVLDLRRDLLRRVHAGDLHVAAERDRADRVLRLAAPRLRPQRREEQREALDAHPDRLGGREVAELVQHDQGREAQERQDPAHAASAPTELAGDRAGVAVGPVERVEGVHAGRRDALERLLDHRRDAHERQPAAEEGVDGDLVGGVEHARRRCRRRAPPRARGAGTGRRPGPAPRR